MKRNILFTFALSALLIQTAFAQNFTNAGVNNETRGYLLGPGDKIQVKVLGEKEFDFETEIDQNGRFRVPFAEDEPVTAKCRTESEIREDVKSRFSKYLKDPTISLTIAERRKPTPVTIYGEVTNQQRVELTRETTLMELIAFSGGVKEDSAGGNIRVIRTQAPMCAEEAEIISPLKMYTISSITSGNKESNPVIYPGDIIYVEKASPVYINGEVNNTAGVYIKENGLTLSQALGMVGGPRDTANLKDVRIYRLKPNSQDRDIITVNFKAIQAGTEKDVMLEPYDVIDIDKKKDSIGKVILKAITGAATTGITSLGTGIPGTILY